MSTEIQDFIPPRFNMIENRQSVFGASMEPDANGPWLKWEDYAHLRNEFLARRYQQSTSDTSFRHDMGESMESIFANLVTGDSEVALDICRDALKKLWGYERA